MSDVFAFECIYFIGPRDPILSSKFANSQSTGFTGSLNRASDIPLAKSLLAQIFRGITTVERVTFKVVSKAIIILGESYPAPVASTTVTRYASTCP